MNIINYTAQGDLYVSTALQRQIYFFRVGSKWVSLVWIWVTKFNKSLYAESLAHNASVAVLANPDKSYIDMLKKMITKTTSLCHRGA